MRSEAQTRQVRLVGGPLDGQIANVDSMAFGNLASHDKQTNCEVVYEMRPEDNSVLDYVGMYPLCSSEGC